MCANRANKNNCIKKHRSQTCAGDGALFVGRGFIHLTGRDNYKKKFYDPWKKEYPNETRKLEDMVPLLETDIDLAIKVSMIFWKSTGINIKADAGTDNPSIDKVGAVVNGSNPPKGKDTRRTYTQNAINNLK